MQWLREQGLMAADECLSNPLPTDSISSITQAVRYKRLAYFSRSFIDSTTAVPRIHGTRDLPFTEEPECP